MVSTTGLQQSRVKELGRPEGTRAITHPTVFNEWCRPSGQMVRFTLLKLLYQQSPSTPGIRPKGLRNENSLHLDRESIAEKPCELYSGSGDFSGEKAEKTKPRPQARRTRTRRFEAFQVGRKM